MSQKKRLLSLFVSRVKKCRSGKNNKQTKMQVKKLESQGRSSRPMRRQPSRGAVSYAEDSEEGSDWNDDDDDDGGDDDDDDDDDEDEDEELSKVHFCSLMLQHFQL